MKMPERSFAASLRARDYPLDEGGKHALSERESRDNGPGEDFAGKGAESGGSCVNNLLLAGENRSTSISGQPIQAYMKRS